MKPTQRTDEQQILRDALARLAETVGIEARVLAEAYPDTAKDRRYDAVIGFDAGGRQARFAVEIKRPLTTQTVGMAVAQLEGAPEPGMLVADYVNPNLAEKLKDMGVAFLDTAGNAFLDVPPLFVFIKGNRAKDRPGLKGALKPTRAFQPTGLVMLFGLLTRPELLEKPYRDIADATNVALGTVGRVFTDLRQHGFIYETEDGTRRFAQRRALLERWVEAYAEKLRPKLVLGLFTAPKHRWWERVDGVQSDGAQWGGEVAAEKLTDYLRPEKVTLYADALNNRFLARHALQRDPEGEVEILERFWAPAPTGENYPPDLVPPLLVYADLVATGDARNIEAAKLIDERYLA